MKFRVELRYADTDQMGLIYFARHLIYADEAVGKFFRELGVNLLELERRGIYLAVVHAEANFENPLRYGEECEVEVEVDRVGRSSVGFSFKVFGNGILKSYGRIVYVFTNSKGKIEIPTDIKITLEKLLNR